MLLSWFFEQFFVPQVDINRGGGGGGGPICNCQISVKCGAMSLEGSPLCSEH